MWSRKDRYAQCNLYISSRYALAATGFDMTCRKVSLKLACGYRRLSFGALEGCPELQMNAVRLNLGFALTCSSLLDAWFVVILSVLWNVRVGTVGTRACQVAMTRSRSSWLFTVERTVAEGS